MIFTVLLVVFAKGIGQSPKPRKLSLFKKLSDALPHLQLVFQESIFGLVMPVIPS